MRPRGQEQVRDQDEGAGRGEGGPLRGHPRRREGRPARLPHHLLTARGLRQGAGS